MPRALDDHRAVSASSPPVSGSRSCRAWPFRSTSRGSLPCPWLSCGAHRRARRPGPPSGPPSISCAVEQLRISAARIQPRRPRRPPCPAALARCAAAAVSRPSSPIAVVTTRAERCAASSMWVWNSGRRARTGPRQTAPRRSLSPKVWQSWASAADSMSTASMSGKSARSCSARSAVANFSPDRWCPRAGPGLRGRRLPDGVGERGAASYALGMRGTCPSTYPKARRSASALTRRTPSTTSPRRCPWRARPRCPR